MLQYSKVYKDNVPCVNNIVDPKVVKVLEAEEHGVSVKFPKVPWSSTDRIIATKNVDINRILRFKQMVTCNLTVKMKVSHKVWVDPVKCASKQIARSCNVDKKSYVPRKFSQPIRKTGWQEFKAIVSVVRHRTVAKKRFTTELFPEQRHCTRTQNSMDKTKHPVYNEVPRAGVSSWPCVPLKAVLPQDRIGVVIENGVLVARHLQKLDSVMQ